MFRLILLLALYTQYVFGNTEKVIFLAPNNVQVPVEHPTLEDLHLEALSPQHWSLRTHIEAEFPSDVSKYGQPSWYLLHNLQEGQRYEVRICWAATQPTSFRLETYDLSTVFESPDLITSLAQFSEARQPEFLDTESQEPSIAKANKKFKHASKEGSSTLFLQVFAAADYYTMNKTIMENVPPVFVDIILDPYVHNVFPRSLLPTGVYIIILAIGGWYLAVYISKLVQSIGKVSTDVDKKKA